MTNTKTSKLLLALALSLSAVLTGCTRIGPGHVGIVVDQAGSNRGVLSTPVRTGWVFHNPFSSSVIEYSTGVQTVVWTKDVNEGNPSDESVTFTNKDSMAVNADVNLSYSLVADKVPAFYVKFLTEDLKPFTDGFMRNAVRNCLNDNAGKYEIAQLIGDNAKFIADSHTCLEAELALYGVHIEQFGIIGAPRPPQIVLDQINQKIQANQIALRKEMELTQVTADAAKQVAAAKGHADALVAEANGEAEANRIRTASITPTILQMKALENQHDMIWRWNGQTPSTVLGSGSSTLLQLPKD